MLQQLWGNGPIIHLLAREEQEGKGVSVGDNARAALPISVLNAAVGRVAGLRVGGEEEDLHRCIQQLNSHLCLSDARQQPDGLVHQPALDEAAQHRLKHCRVGANRERFLHINQPPHGRVHVTKVRAEGKVMCERCARREHMVLIAVEQ